MHNPIASKHEARQPMAQRSILFARATHFPGYGTSQSQAGFALPKYEQSHQMVVNQAFSNAE